VQLYSSDTTEATVPDTVIIAANQASATFEVQGIDDVILDGTQAVVITAKPTYTGTNITLDTGNATANLNVVDNESPSLNIVIDKDVISETGTATATITRNTDITSQLARISHKELKKRSQNLRKCICRKHFSSYKV
jgi:hypothetical protein